MGVRSTAAVLALLLSFVEVRSLDNGLGRVPAMGYNSWYDLMGSLNETNLIETVDKMIELGLPKLGYVYFNLDDDWALSRDSTGRLIADPARFTEGSLKYLADYVHAKNLRFGTYTDRGNLTCGGKPGALGYEGVDAETYAEWGVDYLKEDSCYASTDHDTAFEEYGKMRDALNATGRPILFSLCGWNPWYAPKGQSLGNSWRIGPDDTNWDGVLANIDINADLFEYAGPGGFNDPCLLLAEDGSGNQRITERQSRFQFSMWSVMTSPLLISANLRHMSPTNLATYTNLDVIAINQDVDGRQGQRIVGGPLSGKNATNVWAKRLSDGGFAVAFANTGPVDADIACDPSCWAAIVDRDVGTGKCTAVDLWEGTHMSIDLTEGYTAEGVAPDGGILLLRVVC